METKKDGEGHVAELPLFHKMVDGKNYEWKIANVENPKIVAQSGIVQIEVIRKSNIKSPRVSFSKITDPSTGITYGLPRGIDKKTGDLKFDRIILGEIMQFDLANIVDRRLWMVICRHQCMEGSPYASGKPLYRIYDKDAEATKIIKQSKAKRRASAIAEDLTGADLYDMANNLGLSAEHNSFNVLVAEVIKKAEIDPDGFLAIWDNAQRPILTVFNRCRVVGLIESDVLNGYMWKKNYPLGLSEAAAVKTMSNNPQLLVTMDMESKQRSEAFKKHATEKQREIIEVGSVSPITTVKEQEFLTNEEVAKQLNEIKGVKNDLNAELEEVLKLKAQLKEAVAAIPPKQEPTLEQLQKKAFDLGMANAHEITNIEELKKEIRARKPLKV